MSQDEAILEAKGITKAFGGIVDSKNLSMYVNRGDVVGLIGPNGAGKTTLFNILMGGQISPLRSTYGRE